MKNGNFEKVTVEHSKAWSESQMPRMTGYNIGCCDCGLVHQVNFKVGKVIKEYKNGYSDLEIMDKKSYKVLMIVKRNNKLTKQQRKICKYPKI